MEENKLDIYQIIGFLFLIAAIFWWFNVTIPDLEKNALEEKEIISQNQSQEINNNPIKNITEVVSSSINSTVIGSQSESEEIVIENDDVIFKFNTKGGSLTELQLKGYVDYKGDDLFLIKNNNQNISLSFDLKNGNKINTSDYNFSYEMLREGKVNVLKMSLIISEDQSVSFEYKIPKSGYMIDFSVKSSGFYSLINGDSNVNLNWSLDAFRQAKSIDYENRYSQLMYQYEGDDTDYLSSYSDSDDSEDSVSWISYGQHFFNSILILDTQTDNVQFESKKLFEDESKEAKFTKNYSSIIPLNLSGSEINSQMKWYFGPNDYDILKEYENKIYDSIYFGWGIFGMINRFIYFPFFGFLSKYFSAGLAVILMTIATRVVMSPVTYKTYVSQARMKVIKPEITELIHCLDVSLHCSSYLCFMHYFVFSQ